MEKLGFEFCPPWPTSLTHRRREGSMGDGGSQRERETCPHIDLSAGDGAGQCLGGTPGGEAGGRGQQSGRPWHCLSGARLHTGVQGDTGD